MKGKKWVFAALCSILVLAVAVTGCKAAPPVKETIKVGFSCPLSGWASVGLETILNPYTMWAEKINEEGGLYVKDIGQRIPVELVYYDSKSSADEVIKIYERLITVDKVDILLSPWSTYACFPLVPLVEKYHVPLIAATCGTSEILGVDANYFWVPGCLLGNASGGSLVNFLRDHKDEIGTRIAYMGLIHPFVLDFKNNFIPAAEAEGFEIVLNKDYPMGVTDLSEVLVETKGLNPDALVVGSITADMILIMKQSMEIGFSPKFMYFLVGPGVSEFFDIFGEATDGVCGLGQWDRYGPGPGSTEFYDWYVDRWDKVPDMTDAPIHWWSVQVMEQAIEKAGTLDWEKVNEVIATEEFTTILGPTTFGPDQLSQTGIGGTSGCAVAQAQKGEIRLVHPPKWASAEFIYPKPPW